ncbi:hypothetical protein [Altererythrobacter lutimaris]|uniref:Uncharacterized protein n=1 Tax=Altererythrobacter lutimaris TaxID=2743979 RepID=A0A850H7L7_9SPHN|nr:hypothetical protein [Altererythrobacter lutimaris]NVE93759.1 hypothetical protein [Altererythrobacter lutimaris]
MTQSNDMSQSGEQRLKDRRRNFWRYVGIAIFVAMLAGFFSGFLMGTYENGEIGLWVPLSAGVVAIALWIWFSVDYFKRIDELDLMDNLWSHLIGVYGAVMVYGSWFLLAELDLTPEPTALGIILALIGFTFLAYGARRLGWR